MTVEEAKEYLLSRYLVVGSPLNPPKDECEKHNDALDVAIYALEAYQAYRAIGTVEELKSMKEKGSFSGVELAQIAVQLNELKEYKKIGTIERFRELTEKAEPKKLVKPSGLSDKFHHIELCPSCKARFRVHRARNRCTEVVVEMNYCPKCGKRIKISEV